MFKPAVPFNVAAELLVPTYETVLGVPTKTFPAQGELIFCSFRSFGGTERDVDGLYSIEDTAVVETWFRPDIKGDCRIRVSTGEYEVIGQPENIELRNQYLKFKVRRVKGGA